MFTKIKTNRTMKEVKKITAVGRYFLLTALLCSSTLGVFSQDVITKKDGTEIQAKVTEIGTNEIKYTRFGATSPTYTLSKSEIFMIKYEDGAKDMFNEETVKESNVVNNAQTISPNLTTYKYTFGNAINPIGNKKNAWGSGIASFFIPGLGQFINGDIGGGFLFLGTNIACNVTMMAAEDPAVVIIGLICGLTVNICSIVNAAQIAKKVNMARGYQLGNNTYLKVEPTIINTYELAQQDFKNSAYGMAMRVTF